MEVPEGWSSLAVPPGTVVKLPSEVAQRVHDHLRAAGVAGAEAGAKLRESADSYSLASTKLRDTIEESSAHQHCGQDTYINSPADGGSAVKSELSSSGLTEVLRRCLHWHVGRPMDKSTVDREVGMQELKKAISPYFDALINQAAPDQAYPNVPASMDIRGLVSQLFRHYRAGYRISDNWNDQFVYRIRASLASTPASRRDWFENYFKN